MPNVANDTGFHSDDTPERRVAERRSFGSHRGIRVDRRAGTGRRHSGDVAPASSGGVAERRSGQDRRGVSSAWPLERRSGRDRRRPS
jgi:hypothetical protein